jgi:preprotein translocase subunit SecG
MYGLLIVVHLIVCIALIAVVLVQSGKGGGLAGGAFGGSAQTVFGGRGATDFFTRATMVLGGAFFVTSLVLALLSAGGAGIGGTQRSLVQEEARQRSRQQAAPTQPGAPAAPAPVGGGKQAAPAPAPTQAPAPAPGGGGK